MSERDTDFWSIVQAPADEDRDRRISQAAATPFLLGAVEAYILADEAGRMGEYMEYVSQELATALEDVGITMDAEAGYLLFGRCVETILDRQS